MTTAPGLRRDAQDARPAAAPALAARPAARRAAALAGWLAAGALLFSCYLQISRTVPVDSDGAGNALQAWDMLHGNLLLHGWRLSDVSFYTTELPEYMLVELARGLRPDVVHVAGAITFTLLVLLAALLARGRQRGREAVAAMVIAAGIMLAPQLGSGVYVLMLDPGPRRDIGALAAGLAAARPGAAPLVRSAGGVGLLAWALVADGLVLITGVLPLLAVCGVRCYRDIVTRRQPPASRWFELSLAAGAVLAAVTAKAVLALIARAGRFPGLAGGFRAGRLRRSARPRAAGRPGPAAAVRRRFLQPRAGPGRGAGDAARRRAGPGRVGRLHRRPAVRRPRRRRPGGIGPDRRHRHQPGRVRVRHPRGRHSQHQGDHRGAAVRRGARGPAAGPAARCGRADACPAARADRLPGLPQPRAGAAGPARAGPAARQLAGRPPPRATAWPDTGRPPAPPWPAGGPCSSCRSRPGTRP